MRNFWLNFLENFALRVLIYQKLNIKAKYSPKIIIRAVSVNDTGTQVKPKN